MEQKSQWIQNSINKVSESLQIPAPPSFIFENSSATDSILNENVSTFMLEKVEFPAEGGIFVYVKGAKEPKKGFPFPEAIFAINIVKRLILNSLKFISRRFMLPSVIFVSLMPYKVKIRIMEEVLNLYVEVAEKALNPYYLKDRFLTKFSRELGSISYDLLVEMGVNKKTAYRTAKTIETIFEYDDAYRYRLEDILSETSKVKLLKDTRGEVRRLNKIFKDREVSDRISFVANNIARIANLLLIHPKVKKAVINTIKLSRFENLQYDKYDKYWCSMRIDYKFLGTLLEERNVDLVLSYSIRV